jgi:ubiquinone/menaquinone biosynthesis C-methylase UbiE
MKILDAGCGTGTVTRKMALNVSPGKAYGVDIDPMFINEAKRLALREGVGNVVFELGNIENLPYDNGTFDLSYCRLVLMHVLNPVKTIKELKRVTKKGGIIAASDTDDGGMFMFPQSLKALDLWAKYGKRAQTRGDNRYIGRQLYAIFAEAGLTSIDIYPTPMFATQRDPDVLKMLANTAIQILGQEKDAMIKNGETTVREWEEAMAEFQLVLKHPGAFITQGSFLAVGKSDGQA